MDEKTEIDPIISSEESDDEIFFDDDLLTEDNFDIKLEGDVYEVETDVLKSDWDVIHDDTAIRTDLILHYEEEALRNSRKTELSTIEKYRIVDRTDTLLRFIQDYATGRMGQSRYESISQRFHPTLPLISTRKRCFGEANDLYGPPVEKPFRHSGLANIKYDMSNIHPHVRHYLKGRFINDSLIPIIDDLGKIYIDKMKGDDVEDDIDEPEIGDDDKKASFIRESKLIFSDAENSLFSLHSVYHPNPPNSKYKKNGMSRDKFEQERVDIEKPFININNPIYDVRVNNYNYWGEDMVLSSYKAIRSVSFEERLGITGESINSHVLNTRKVLGPSMRYVDVIREGEIKKISGSNCCIGTVEDNAYENKYRGKRENEEFNYQINTPPERKEYINGELVSVTGYMYKSPKNNKFTDDGVNLLDIIGRKPCKEYIYYDVPVDFENVETKTSRGEFLKTQISKIKKRVQSLIDSSEKRPTRDVTFYKELYYKIDDVVFRFAPHYTGKKFYHGYTLLSNTRKITAASLYPQDYKIDDWTGSTYILEKGIDVIVAEFSNFYYPEIYSNKKGHVATFVDEFKEGDLVLWNASKLSHYEGYNSINRVKKIYKTRQKTKDNFNYKIELEHVYDGGVEYVLHAEELIGITEVVSGFFSNWLKHNSFDFKHTFKNKRYFVENSEKFLKTVKEHKLEAQNVLLHTVLPSVNLIVDDIFDIHNDHVRYFGNGYEESKLINLKKMLSSFGIKYSDLSMNDSTRRLFKIRDDLTKQAIKVIGENNEKTVLNTSTETNIRNIIKEQDELLYKKLLNLLPYTDTVLNEKEKDEFEKNITKMYDELPENSRALDVYSKYRGVSNIKRLIDNTLKSFLQNRENHQNYIAHLYNLLMENKPYHMNFSNLSKTAEESMIDYSTDIFEIYSHINDEIKRKLTNTFNDNKIILDRFDYKRLCNSLHNSYDNGEYFYALTNLLQLTNTLSDNPEEEGEEEDLKRLEDEYKLVRKIYENEREKSQIYKDTCNNVIVVKIYKSREELEADNYTEHIKIDPEFETLVADMEVYKQIVEGTDEELDDEQLKSLLLEKMRDYYIFCNTATLENKVENILENRDNTVVKNRAYREVREGEYALLINLYERHLYKRVRNIWVIHEVGAINDATCSTDELAIVHKTFEDVLRDVGSAHSYMKSDYFDSNCLPQSILGWAKKMREIADRIDANKDSTDKRASTRVLIDRYKKQITKYSRMMRLRKSRDDYFRRLLLKNSSITKSKKCPFTNMIIDARNRDNIRDMLESLKTLTEDWDWTDIRPTETLDDEENIEDIIELDEDIDDLEAGHTGDREYLFRGESPEIIKELQIDDVGLYSVSDSVIANQMTNILNRHIRKSNMGTDLTIADGMACVGGNSISFARSNTFKMVISNELDNNRYKMLENNLIDVLKFGNVNVINSSILDAEFLNNIDILFLDPEWSDKSGKSKNKITIGTTELDNFVEHSFENYKRIKIIALKLPSTYDKTLLSKFNSDKGYSKHTYYLGDRSNIMYIIIVRDNDDMILIEEPSGVSSDYLYPIDSPNPESSKICKHFVDMFPMIGMTDEEAYDYLRSTVVNKWVIESIDNRNICKNCGETITISETAEDQFKTREGRSTVTREVVASTFRSMDTLLDLEDERFTRERLVIYTVISDILRVTKLRLSKKQLEELVFSSTDDFTIDYPKALTDIRKIGDGYDKKNTYNVKNSVLYRDTRDKTGAGNTKYTKVPFSDLPTIIPFYKTNLKNPKSFEEFTNNWNEYIETVFSTPRMAKFVKYKETLLFSDDNEDRRFTVENWEDFVFEFIKMRKEVKAKQRPIKTLNGIAAYATVYLYKYYSTLIIRSVSKLILFLQANGSRTDDSVTLYGYPMKNLPVSYLREGDYPIPQIVNNIKALSQDRNRRGRYPWTIFSDKHVSETRLIERIKTEITRINNKSIQNALNRRVKELIKNDETVQKLSKWESFRPNLETRVPKPWKAMNINKLPLHKLEGYYKNITQNILYELQLEIAESKLENGANLNNSCCLTNVHLDYDRPITNYFAYFTETFGSNKRLLKLFDEAYRVDREIRMVKSRYTIMRYDRPRDLRERLLIYLSKNFEETVTIGDKDYSLKNISFTNNIFLNYCYNEENFGQKRLFQRSVDVDMYVYDELVREMEEDDEITDDVETLLKSRLKEKYAGLLSDEEIERKCVTILEYNGEYETCVISGIRRYDIMKNLEKMLMSGELVDAYRRLNKRIRMENVLHRKEISSTIFYKPERYIDQARDVVTTLEILNIHLGEICPSIGNLLDAMKKKLDKSSKFLHKIGVEPDDVSYENWLYSFASKTVNMNVKESKALMNKLFDKYSSTKRGLWTKKIGNMENVYNYLYEKIDTNLRILGFTDAEIKVEREGEMLRLEGYTNRFALSSVKKLLVYFKSLMGLFSRICENGISVLETYDMSFTEEVEGNIREAFASSGFKTRMASRVNYKFPIGIIEYFIINEIHTEHREKPISLFDYETSVIFMKTILIEMINNLFVVSEKHIPSKSLDAEYNRNIAKLIEVLIIDKVELDYEFHNISSDKVDFVNNVLSGIRNKRRLDDYSEVMKDKAGGLHKAFRMIGMGREFNAGRGFDKNIGISDIYNADISNFNDEYGEVLEGEQMGVMDSNVGGEDNNDEIDGYYGD